MQLSALFLLSIIFSGTFSEKVNRKKEKGCVENLCSKGKEKYPSKQINRLLRTDKFCHFKINGSSVIEPLDHSSTNSVPLKATLRAPSLPQEENLCKTRRITRSPKYDKISKKTIVNTKEYQQRVVFELCFEENSNCQNTAKIFTIKTFCKQLYNKVRLLYYENGELHYGQFAVPNACVCMFRKENRFDKAV